MKILAIAGLALLIVLVGAQLYSFLAQENKLSQALGDAQARLTKAQNDEANLSETVQYLNNPVNVTKELRSQFNYKKPGETMIVIVPETSSTAASGE